MLTSAVRLLFGNPASAAVDQPAVAPENVPEPPDRPRPSTIWPASRLALNNHLWGDGFIFPGGEAETLRLVRPLGASAAASLLLVGVGGGGPACTAVRNLGTWVTGLDNDPSLLAAARGLVSRSQLTKKISIEAWNPANPKLPANSHHHCLALEPLNGAQPEPILDGLTRAVKPGGGIVITELAAPVPLNPKDPTVRRWCDLEHRDPAAIPAPVAITRMLGRLGVDVRVAEDISDRHLEQAMLSWRVMVRELRGRRPTRQEAVVLVAEAELWLMRRRLMRDGRLRMMRWHALTRGRDQADLPLVNGLSTA